KELQASPFGIGILPCSWECISGIRFRHHKRHRTGLGAKKRNINFENLEMLAAASAMHSTLSLS
ncbi:MAG: hypothetical protein WCL50_07380, partial [Spirochaetota bacterium]